jgi:peptidoglycan/xylan/chitin deacetylase (PgdA/CDA1 family)
MVRALPWARVPFGAAVAGAAAVVGAAALGWTPPAWVAPVVALALLASVAAGVFVMGSGLFARPVLAGDRATSAGKVALTFDDGPDPAHTPRVLDLLEADGHRATFFVIGARADEHPALIAEIVRRGHALGNHSYAHARLSAALPVARLTDDLERAQATLTRAQGRAPRWFRPPAGVLSPRVTEAARRAGLELVGWTATARDGIATPVERALARLTRAVRPGAILVLHDAAERRDRPPIVADVLPRLLEVLRAQGLRSVTLDELCPPPPKSRRS